MESVFSPGSAMFVLYKTCMGTLRGCLAVSNNTAATGQLMHKTIHYIALAVAQHVLHC